MGTHYQTAGNRKKQKIVHTYHQIDKKNLSHIIADNLDTKVPNAVCNLNTDKIKIHKNKNTTGDSEKVIDVHVADKIKNIII